MCGIICVVTRPTQRSVPNVADLIGRLDESVSAAIAGDIARAAVGVATVDTALRGDAGQLILADNLELAAGIISRVDRLEAVATTTEHSLEALVGVSAPHVERFSNDLISLRDATWSLRNDRLRTARLVDALAGKGASPSARLAYYAIQQALSAIDRMEVRGRDSAGVHVMVWGHGISPADDRVTPLLADRLDDQLFASGSVRVGSGEFGAWSFVYKAAAEIGELGDNTRVMRGEVLEDALLRMLVSQAGTRVAILGHTRWASV
ncbi:MAG: hypothetical protein AAB327_00795 [Actinomycetota bacterium]